MLEITTGLCRKLLYQKHHHSNSRLATLSPRAGKKSNGAPWFRTMTEQHLAAAASFSRDFLGDVDLSPSGDNADLCWRGGSLVAKDD